MSDNQPHPDAERRKAPRPTEPGTTQGSRTGLEDPRAVDILTTEHWSLLSTRTLGYQEMFGRATMFVAILSGTVVALALLAQAASFGRETLSFALVLLSVSLFVGLATFIRCVAINYEDARWIAGMALLRHAYLRIVPEIEPFFIEGHAPGSDERGLTYGSPQRLGSLTRSLTTTSAVVAALDSLVAGSIASDVGALFGVGLFLDLAVGAVISIVSAVFHVRYAGRFREKHAASTSASR